MNCCRVEPLLNGRIELRLCYLLVYPYKRADRKPIVDYILTVLTTAFVVLTIYGHVEEKNTGVVEEQVLGVYRLFTQVRIVAYTTHVELVQQMAMIYYRKVNMGEQVTTIRLGYVSLPFAVALPGALLTLWRWIV